MDAVKIIPDLDRVFVDEGSEFFVHVVRQSEVIGVAKVHDVAVDV